jgi:integrase
MESQDVERLLAEKAAAPHAAKSLLKALRSVAKVAVKLALISKDPTAGVKVRAPTSEAGFKMWEESDIARFEARYRIGSRERLALGLLLYTGQRRGDIIRIGPQHERGGCLELLERVCKTVSPDLQTVAQGLESKREEISNAGLVWTSTSRTSPSASTARQR